MSGMSSSKPLRFLLLVNRGMSSSFIDDAVETALSLLKEELGISAQLVDSVFWYKEQFSRCGDWSSWIWETVSGKNYDTRETHFSGFILCEEELGKANAQIVDLALRNGKIVLFARKNCPLSSISEVQTVDKDNWQRGWRVKVEGNIQ
jgi:hypothetical protein